MLEMLVLAALSGPVVYGGLRLARAYSTWIDSLSPWAKRSVTTVVGVLLAWGSQRLGVVVGPDPTAWTPELLVGVLTAVIGHVMHRTLEPAATPEALDE